MLMIEHSQAVPGGETLSSVRWRILLGLLAEREAERLGLSPTRTHLNAVTQGFRVEFGLPHRSDVEGFLRFAGLNLQDFSAQMRTFSQLIRVQDYYTPQLERGLPRYLAFMGLQVGG